MPRRSVALECGGLAGELLPAADNYVDVLGIDIQSMADAAGKLSGDERRARSQERIINHFATFGVI